MNATAEGKTTGRGVEQRIRVLIAEDHEMVAAGLKMLLSQRPDLDVLDVARSEPEAVAKAQRLRPDLVLMDAVLREGGGVKACREIKKVLPGCKVIFVTAFASERLVMDAVNAGASGYLLKESSSERLLEGIDQVLAGQTALDVRATQHLMAGVQAGLEADGNGKADLISPQERAVMALVATGRTNKEIAQDMRLSDKTVKNYLSNAMKKLGFSRRSQVAAFYVQNAALFAAQR